MIIRTAQDLLKAWYGDGLISNILETDVTVGTSAVLVAKRDGSVTERIITNNGAASIFVSSKSSVAANTGIQIAPNATLSFQVLTDFDLASCDLFAISTGAGNAVHVISVQLVGAE